MLQTGMRAPMGIKVFGPDLETIENFGMQLEGYLKEVPSVNPNAVFADRIVGKPYLEIDLDRVRMARYGLSIRDVQDYIEIAIGGMPLSTTVEGRERFPIRARYAREWRDDPEMIAGSADTHADRGSDTPGSDIRNRVPPGSFHDTQ
jgi:copper/silver efflux system protein